MSPEDRPEEVTARLTAEAQRILARILEKMGVQASLESLHRDGHPVLNAVCGEDDRFVIGRKGKTLDAIQLILHRIVRRLPDSADFTVDVDVSNYRERRRRRLVVAARRAAERVRETGNQVLIGPYGPAERHLIHTSVGDNPYVMTESQGDGEQKTILFKPRHLIEYPAAEG